MSNEATDTRVRHLMECVERQAWGEDTVRQLYANLDTWITDAAHHELVGEGNQLDHMLSAIGGWMHGVLTIIQVDQDRVNITIYDHGQMHEALGRIVGDAAYGWQH